MAALENVDRLPWVYSVEKLLCNIRRGVFRGRPTINRVTIVDLGPI